MRLDLPPRHAHRVVEHLPLLEIRIRPEKLDVVISVPVPEAAGRALQHVLQRHPRPARRPDRAFGPRRVDQLVAVARVLGDLLDAARPGALEGDRHGSAREKGLVLQVGEADRAGLVDEAVDGEGEGGGGDLGDAAVVADEEVGVVG